MNRGKPCCEAEAMRRIRQISVGDTVVGLSMLEQIFEDVAGADLSPDTIIRSELLRQVKIYNYVPKPAEEAYADAVFAEYQNELKRR
ncbi:hypothetical protein [Methanogenium organophilum]|uniref:Uncharacterized protein n=1 Tax=Methanogenium organophilum TaxID=2199 RepID=A0A9X9S3E7_METOG|nr:hypothetical protein [Methanogenium organophilum]WAI00200.1 hypothetical protein OU421_07085 [Methanogenium organophilum]